MLIFPKDGGPHLHSSPILHLLSPRSRQPTSYPYGLACSGYFIRMQSHEACVAFCIWNLLSGMCLRHIHVAAPISATRLLFAAEGHLRHRHTTLCLFNFDGHWTCFCFSVIINNAAMDHTNFCANINFHFSWVCT